VVVIEIWKFAKEVSNFVEELGDIEPIGSEVERSVFVEIIKRFLYYLTASNQRSIKFYIWNKNRRKKT